MTHRQPLASERSPSIERPMADRAEKREMLRDLEMLRSEYQKRLDLPTTEHDREQTSRLIRELTACIERLKRHVQRHSG